MNVLRIYRPIYNTLNKMSYSNIMVSIHPDELYNLKGSIQTLEREYKKTINCYEKAIQINPNYVAAYNNLGILFN